MNTRYSVITFDMGLTLVTLEPFADMFFRVGQKLGLQANLEALEQATDERLGASDGGGRHRPTTSPRPRPAAAGGAR